MLAELPELREEMSHPDHLWGKAPYSEERGSARNQIAREKTASQTASSSRVGTRSFHLGVASPRTVPGTQQKCKE